MAYRNTILMQILKYVNRYEFKNQVSKYNGDYRTRKMSCYNLLVLMISAQLQMTDTLRGMVISCGTKVPNFYHLGLLSVKRSTVSDALAKRSHKIFENYFFALLKTLPWCVRRKLQRAIHVVDSSTISLCLNLHPWAKFRKTKAGVKIHTMFDPDDMVPELVHLTNAKVHDITAIKKVINFKPGDFYVYDRGYCSYKYLYNIHLERAYYVTRMKINWKYDVVRRCFTGHSDTVLKDELIKVKGAKAPDYPELLRLITFHDKEKDKVYAFMTNNFDVDAETIAAMYKTRWQIELFFKWIKQHLRVKTFYSTKENGIRIQIWRAMITYLLLRLLHLAVEKNIDFYDMLTKIQANLDKRGDIFELLTESAIGESPPPVRIKSMQKELCFVA